MELSRREGSGNPRLSLLARGDCLILEEFNRNRGEAIHLFKWKEAFQIDSHDTIVLESVGICRIRRYQDGMRLVLCARRNRYMTFDAVLYSESKN
jgi:hypothetical protein